MEDLLTTLKTHTPSLIGLEDCKKSAVCIPLIKKGSDYEILFEVRAAHIDSQPGDVCLPGGRLETGELPMDAAIRETKEELLITDDQIEMLGLMDVYYSGRELMLYPYAIELKNYNGSFSADEVAETFRVPLSFFLETEPMRYLTEATVIPGDDFPYELVVGGKNYRWRKRREEVLFYQYEGRVIWGLTAKIIRSFAESVLALRQCTPPTC